MHRILNILLAFTAALIPGASMAQSEVDWFFWTGPIVNL